MASAFAPRRYEGLALHTQAVGYAVDVVEKADHLRGIMNSDIVQACLAQGGDVIRAHLLWLQRELFGVGAERVIHRAKLRPPPITRDGVHEGVGFRLTVKSLDLGPEVMRM